MRFDIDDMQLATRQDRASAVMVNRRLGLLTEQEAHESQATRRPEGSRVMRISIDIEAEDPGKVATLARALLGATSKTTETVTLHVDEEDLAAAVRSGASRALAGQTATHGTSRA